MSWIPLTLLAVVFLLLLLEALSLARERSAIPIRILVLGTRGKTTVAQFTASVLRQAGYRTLAKTTGSRPVLILPDGSQQEILRRGRARIHEQIRVIRRARRLGCDALVVECMAVSPELQRLESHILRPTLAVLTNVLDDHREVYGDIERWRVKAFASTLPSRTVIVSGERRHAEEIRRTGARRGSSVISPPLPSAADPLEAITESNVLLALKVAEELGIDPARGRTAIPPQGPSSMLREVRASGAGPALLLLDAFAVNDTESASKFVAAWKQKLPDWNRTVMLFNTRADRPLRSLQFARWCVRLGDVQMIVLMGTHVPRTRRELLALGFPSASIIRWGNDEITHPAQALQRLTTPDTVFVGIANAVGHASRLMEAVERG